MGGHCPDPIGVFQHLHILDFVSIVFEKIAFAPR